MMKKIRVVAFRLTLVLLIGLLLIWIAVSRPAWQVNATQKVTQSVNPQMLKQSVEALSEHYFPRNYTHPKQLAGAADFIVRQLETTSATVSEQHYEVDQAPYRNIIAEYGPESDQLIVIGAHYDVAGDTPGADDNASGIAGLIELGRLLSNTHLKTKVMLVAFTLEEPPFFRTQSMGSMIHAAALSEQQIEVRLMISLEMIGYFSDQAHTQNYPHPLLSLFYPDQGNFITVVDQLFSNQGPALKQTMRQATQLPVYSINAPSWIPGVDFSDHRSYWQHGYPAVMITDTAFFRNHHYHTDADTAEKLDYERMAQVVLATYTAIIQIANE